MRKFIFVLMFFSFISLVAAQGIGVTSPAPEFSGSSAVFSNAQYFQPGFSGFIGSGYSYNGISREEFNEVCRERQDFLIQILPGSCTPRVVRSDLLAEQSVPVFCQLTATQINPTIDTENIRNIRLIHNASSRRSCRG